MAGKVHASRARDALLLMMMRRVQCAMDGDGHHLWGGAHRWQGGEVGHVEASRLVLLEVSSRQGSAGVAEHACQVLQVHGLRILAVALHVGKGRGPPWRLQ